MKHMINIYSHHVGDGSWEAGNLVLIPLAVHKQVRELFNVLLLGYLGSTIRLEYSYNFHLEICASEAVVVFARAES